MMKRPSTRTIIASTTIIVIVTFAAIILGVLQSQFSQDAPSQSYGSNGTTSSTTAKSIVSVNPNQSTNREFWINTVHLD
jgi:hypothetical protein